MFFSSRKDAGKRLGKRLANRGYTQPLVLAIPKGGIAVALEVARHLEAAMSIVVTRKLPFPDNPESGFGAIAEDGSLYVIESAAHGVAFATRQRTMAEQRAEIARRIALLRNDMPLPDMTGRTVIVVDDGVAMGSTMLATIALCRNAGAGRVVAAAPVASPRVMPLLERRADAVVVLETPDIFRAVASAYDEWHDVSDEEAVALLRHHEKKRNPAH